jgi:toxin YoeB
VKLVFASQAWQDYLNWLSSHPETLNRLNDLIKECTRALFTGTGKPEALRGDLKGRWSRRITLNDRLVYRVSGKAPDQFLEISQCRYHYDR